MNVPWRVGRETPRRASCPLPFLGLVIASAAQPHAGQQLPSQQCAIIQVNFILSFSFNVLCRS